MPSGSAYQGLILPAPRRSAPQRVVSQASTLPPILVPHSASTTYRSGAIQSHFTPSSHAPSHGSYSGAGLPPSLASGSGGGAARPTGLGAKLTAQRRAQILSLMQGHSLQTQRNGNYKTPSIADIAKSLISSGVWNVAGPTNLGIKELSGTFQPAIQNVVPGATGGLYLRPEGYDSITKAYQSVPVLPALPSYDKTRRGVPRTPARAFLGSKPA